MSYLNLKDGSGALGTSRLRERIVVTPDWYERLCGLMSGLHLMADGRFLDSTGAFLPPNPHLKQLLVDFQFNSKECWEPLNYRKEETNEKADYRIGSSGVGSDDTSHRTRG